MNSPDIEKDKIMQELMACQVRVNELERSATTMPGKDLGAARGEFESLFELSPDALVLIDRHSKIARVNSSAERLFGYTRKEMVGSDHDSLLVPDKARAEHKVQMDSYMRSPRVRVMGMGLELRGRRKNGTEFAADIDLGPLEINKEPFVLAVVRDASNRKKLEDDLKKSEGRYRDLVELSPDGIVLHSEGVIVFSNASGRTMLGLKSGEDIVGRSVMDFVHSDYRSAASERIKQTTIEAKLAPVVRGKFIRKDGTPFYADVVSMPYRYGDKLATLSVIRDVTDRVMAEEAKKESEEKYRVLFTTMSSGYTFCQIVTDEKEEPIDFVYLEVNAAFEKLTGLKREEVIGKRITEAIPGTAERNPELFPVLGKVALTGEPASFEIFFQPLQMWYQVQAYSPKRGYFVLLFENITQRKQLEAELENYRWRLETVVAQRTSEFAQANEKLAREIEAHRKSEEGMALRATILDNAREAVFLLNSHGDFVYANEAAIKTYGYSRDEFLGMNLRQLVRPEEAPAIEERLKTAIRVGQLEVETFHVRKDKSLMPVEVRHNVIKTLHGQFIVSVMRDATTRFRLRSLLMRMPVLLWTTDQQLKVTSTTGAGLERIGLKRDEGVGLGLAEYLEKNGLVGDTLAAHQRAYAGEFADFRFESKKYGKSFRGWVAPLRDIGGEISGTIGTAMEAPP